MAENKVVAKTEAQDLQKQEHKEERTVAGRHHGSGCTGSDRRPPVRGDGRRAPVGSAIHGHRVLYGWNPDPKPVLDQLEHAHLAWCASSHDRSRWDWLEWARPR